MSKAPTQTRPAEGLPVEGEVQSFDLSYESHDIPHETNPKWQQIIDNQIALPSDSVGLKMLLQRIRRENASKPSEIVKLANVKLLRQYFTKNYALHHQDIALLFGGTSTTKAQAVKPELVEYHQEMHHGEELPDEHDPKWQELINHEGDLDTKNVGLQMMLRQLRASADSSPTEATYLAGAKILRQFFIKHKHLLHAELEQFGFSTKPTPETSKATSFKAEVPKETDEIWHTFLNGELDVQTNTIAFQMMLQRVRQSVAKNPTTQNLNAGIKIMRQFLIKHQAQLNSELRQLHMGDKDGADNTRTDRVIWEIPDKIDPVWQKLINGETSMVTEAVALKMMLEQIRLSIQRNPSEATRMAGAQILRQYFVKHQYTHSHELQQLTAA